MVKPIVLIVDTDGQSSARIEGLLRQEGFRVTRAYDGNDAVKEVDQEKPNLILMEVKLERLSGIEVCRRLKAGSATRSIPIVFVSELPAEDYRVLCIQNGAERFINKPFDAGQLLQVVRQLTNGYQSSI